MKMSSLIATIGILASMFLGGCTSGSKRSSLEDHSRPFKYSKGFELAAESKDGVPFHLYILVGYNQQINSGLVEKAQKRFEDFIGNRYAADLAEDLTTISKVADYVSKDQQDRDGRVESGLHYTCALSWPSTWKEWSPTDVW